MIKKICTIIITILSASIILHAQVKNPESQEFSAAIDIGITKPFTDVENSDLHLMFKGGIHYQLNPFSVIILDFSKGKLLKEDLDKYQRKYRNNYHQFNLMLNIAIGQVIRNAQRSNALWQSLYLGTGVGTIRSHVTEPSSNLRDALNGRRYNDSDYVIPMNAGLNFPFPGSNAFKLNLNYQFNYAITDELDGYTSFEGNEVYDTFSVFSLGIRYFTNSKRKSPKGNLCFPWQ